MIENGHVAITDTRITKWHIAGIPSTALGVQKMIVVLQAEFIKEAIYFLGIAANQLGQLLDFHLVSLPPKTMLLG